MRKLLRMAIVVSLFAGQGLMPIPAQEQEAPAFTAERASVYGYVTDYLNANVYKADPGSDIGNIAYLRLKGDFKPQENLAFHLEFTYSLKTGNQNPDILLQTYGLLPPGSPSEIQKLEIDQAWGIATFGALDLEFGKIPLGWGTGYVFNPTQRAAIVNVIDPVVEETPGTLSLQPSWSVRDLLTLTGYLAVQDRSHRETVAIQDGRWENLPFGAKVQFTIGSFDISTSFIKEVLYQEGPPSAYQRSWFVGVDMAGAIWDFGVYAEAVLRLPADPSGTEWIPSGFNFEESLEAAAGFDYSFSDIELELRAEYYHQGPGETDIALYDVLKVLSGERPVQGEDYLFARLSKGLPGNHEANLSCLVNLHDGSLAVLPELLLDVYDNLQLRFGAQLFWGQAGSEFNGEYDLGAGVFNITPTSIFASAKLSF